jgi:branched-chain amino acid transport system substrate-binding protein
LGGLIADLHNYETLDEMSSVLGDAATADLVFFSAAPDDVIQGISLMRAAGISVPIVGGDSFDLGNAWGENPNLSGVHFSTHAFVDHSHPDPAMAAFIAAYERANPGQEAGAFAALGYDTARLILAAVAAAGGDDPAAVLAALPALGDFRGLTGTLSYEYGSRIPTKAVTILRVDGGQVSLAGQFAPASVPAP